MLPISITMNLAAADDDGIAQNQTPGAAGNLTLNGALVAGGVATLTSAGAARQILVTTAANESGRILTIHGTDANGATISEQITGPNATTGTTVQFFRTVTRVAINGAATGNIRVGTNSVGGTRAIGLDQWAAGSTAIQVDVLGTANFTVRQTLDDITQVLPELVNWIDHPDSAFVAATASAQGNYAYAPAYTRLVINSGTGTVTFTVRQSLY